MMATVPASLPFVAPVDVATKRAWDRGAVTADEHRCVEEASGLLQTATLGAEPETHEVDRCSAVLRCNTVTLS
jgi:hypothetical protein